MEHTISQYDRDLEFLRGSLLVKFRDVDVDTP